MHFGVAGYSGARVGAHRAMVTMTGIHLLPTFSYNHAHYLLIKCEFTISRIGRDIYYMRAETS